MRASGFPRSKLIPITPNATAETVALLRWIDDMGKGPRIALGTSDHLAGMPDVYPAMDWFETEAVFMANSGGRRPKLLCFEYHDPAWVSRYGSAGTDSVRERIVAANARGQVVVLHNHSGNPVTGRLSREGTVYPPPPVGFRQGTVYDKTGDPITAVLPGGAENAQMIGYMDRMAAFIESCVDANGKKIPIILRMFHEANGAFFWWGGSGGALYIQLWQYFVSYMRDVKGLKNVLYAPNLQDGEVFTSWWPGADYSDFGTVDYYNDSDTPAFDGTLLLSIYNQIKGRADYKPIALAEAGGRYNINTPNFWTSARDVLTTKYRKFAYVVLWRPTWGPSLDDPAASKAAFSAFANDPRVVTV